MSHPLLRILWLWRGRAAWLLGGLAVALASLAAGIGLLTLAGAALASFLAGILLAAPLALRVLGPARVALRYAERLVTHAATFRALADLRVWFFRRLAARGGGGLGFARSGDLLARLVSDVEVLDGLYLRIAVPLAGAALLLPALVWLLWPAGRGVAATVGILFALAAFLLPRAGARAALAAGAAQTAAASALRVAALDGLTGLREVRAYGAEARVLEGLRRAHEGLIATQRRVARGGAAAQAGALLCTQAAVLAVVALPGGPPVARLVGLFLVIAAFEAVQGLPRAGVLAGVASSSAGRVLSAGDLATEPPPPAHAAPAPAGNALRFQAVHFRWAADRPPVFAGLTLEIPAGSRVALLGPSGSGKSTLAALALRVATPQAGSVCLGGTDLLDLAPDLVRSRIGWLSQATHLFADTVRANLLLGRPDASEAQLWAALEAAALAEVVRTLPEGLDTWLGEGGARLSGGQARRVALARAVLQPAPILILDEPASGLDAETERAFLGTLNEAVAGRTLVLIAHRLTGVERLDRIYRLSGGVAVAAAA